MKLRNTAMRGRVKMVWPFDRRLQGLVSWESVAVVMAFRALAVPLSNEARISARDFSSGVGGAVLTSKESEPMIASVHWLMVARCVASAPSDIDLVCGLKSSLLSGTRSSDLRVLAISWSNSGRIV